ncbi:MAG TPA: prepilin-type N-terminal cleavage/methylation domain-containing protein [Candidatus Omnitrophota bacterium]|nr:prepilin-type N-terminal cleavage/methylation domain-containing protein [Candidatus Omnitrophota bacterium]HNQ50206.1 prepilin-type N-terminal cleavage/methylation domain-containing protein [Candidatus Omnitrophota bacterium]HQO38814.1 prepilin-type N-terminal cleavage/methylation domain-containing protein [Candidatus Omnitrophota bacterium]HQQ06551.1 prepilin-type N-terminal cleavage/methylation domain-containing protein [Candidatus Omnitrophota bacterium]
MLLRQRSPGNKAGFTLVEVMISAFIMMVIMAALVMTLRVGDLSTAIGTERVDLESEVKMLVHWLSKDIRQAKIQELYNNTPSADHIKFNLWEWDNATLSQIKTDEFIEYEYDPSAEVLTRRYIVDNVTEHEVNFTDIVMHPFHTSYTNESAYSFNGTSLLSNRRLIVAIKKEKEARDSLINFTMFEEIRIRNE